MAGDPTCFGVPAKGVSGEIWEVDFFLSSNEMFVYHQTATVKLFFSVWVVILSFGVFTIE